MQLPIANCSLHAPLVRVPGIARIERPAAVLSGEGSIEMRILPGVVSLMERARQQILELRKPLEDGILMIISGSQLGMPLIQLLCQLPSYFSRLRHL